MGADRLYRLLSFGSRNRLLITTRCDVLCRLITVGLFVLSIRILLLDLRVRSLQNGDERLLKSKRRRTDKRGSKVCLLGSEGTAEAERKQNRPINP